MDFDNWRDWAHEEDDGKAEYDNYMDVSDATVFTTELLYIYIGIYKIGIYIYLFYYNTYIYLDTYNIFNHRYYTITSLSYLPQHGCSYPNIFTTIGLLPFLIQKI